MEYKISPGDHSMENSNPLYWVESSVGVNVTPIKNYDVFKTSSQNSESQLEKEIETDIN